MADRILKSLTFPGLPDKYLIPQGTVTEADLEEAEGKKADAIVRSASGEIASYDDGGDLPMKSLKVNIVPKQSGSGDPSPDNVRPISGTDEVKVTKCGKNLLDPNQGANGYIDASGDVVLFSGSHASDYIKVNAGQTVTMSYTRISEGEGTGIRIAWYDKNKTFIQRDGEVESVSVGRKSSSAVAPQNAVYVRASSRNCEQMLVIGTNTDYQAYNSTDISITLPSTVYGGTLDVVSGKLVIDRAFYQYDNINTQSGTAVTGGWRCDFPCPNDDINRGKWTAADGIPLFSMFANKALADGGFSKGYSANGYTVIVPNATSKAEADTILNGLQLCYWLATPIEIQLTPTEVKSLLGDNNVWSDSGTVEVEYRADTSLVINKILEALEG